jgi:N-acetylmuramoyl-L-alanine amidase
MTLKVRERTKYIVIHCSDEPAGRKTDANTIRKWHRQRGWLDIGYHYVVKTDGDVEVGREPDVMGAHVRGHNQHSIGICLIGGAKDDLSGPEDNFTDAQWNSLATLVGQVLSMYPEAEVIGHRDLDPRKACPSFDASGWWLG